MDALKSVAWLIFSVGGLWIGQKIGVALELPSLLIFCLMMIFAFGGFMLALLTMHRL